MYHGYPPSAMTYSHQQPTDYHAQVRSLAMQQGHQKTYKSWSIANIVLGFLFGLVGMILGIMAYLKSKDVELYRMTGDHTAAEHASGHARRLNIGATVCNILGVIGLIITIALVVTYIGSYNVAQHG